MINFFHRIFLAKTEDDLRLKRLREISKQLKETNDRIKENNVKLREINDRIKENNVKLREIVDRVWDTF